MKYNTAKQDLIVIFYNDGISDTKVPLQRWEFHFGGCKASKGFAPMYVYSSETREISALVAGPVALPAMRPEEFHQAVISAAQGGGRWQRLMSDEEIIRAADIALECKREGRHALFFANRVGNFNLMKEALERTDTEFRAMSGATVFEEREQIINEFQGEYKEGDAVVLLLTDTYATGISFRDPEMVVVHLDFPEKNPALILQREARTRPQHRPVVYSVSLDVDSRIAEMLENRNHIVDSIL